MDVVRRAKALGAVASGKPLTEAAHEAGLKSGKGVSKLVKRFNTHGLAALSIAAGRGRKPTYTSQQHARILAEVQREPDREKVRHVLHEGGYSYQRTRTWVRTGYALRVRKSGTVTTYDSQTPEKKD